MMPVSLKSINHNDHAELEQVRQLFRDYAVHIGVDLSFQNFAEEIATLPRAYTVPEGRLYLAKINDQPIGCVGVRKLADGVCEMKRLYVNPAKRGMGAGRLLAQAAIQAAQELGYQRLFLDTLPTMHSALKLYSQLGFKAIPAYYSTPIEGTVFLALDLNMHTQDEQLSYLFDHNRAWAREMTELDPEFFTRLSEQQAPQYLWIGCADSRVPVNQVIGLLPGQVFVHRNIANVVVHTDLNCLSVLQFAVDLLKVRHIMVVGHYGCSGVRAALEKQRVGLADLWLQHVQAVRERHSALLDREEPTNRHKRLCELNVLEQVANVCRTPIVDDAWRRGQSLTVHGWIYGVHDGLLRDLGLTINQADQLATCYTKALSELPLTSQQEGTTV